MEQTLYAVIKGVPPPNGQFPACLASRNMCTWAQKSQVSPGGSRSQGCWTPEHVYSRKEKVHCGTRAGDRQ